MSVAEFASTSVLNGGSKHDGNTEKGMPASYGSEVQHRRHPTSLPPASSSNGTAAVNDRGDRIAESRMNLRIDELARERDGYQELLRDAVSRIFDLETQLRLESEHPELELLQQKAIEIYKKSKMTINALNNDAAELRQMYKMERNEKGKIRLELVAAQKELELLRTRSKLQENNLNESESTIKRLTDECFSLQQALATSESTITMFKQERNVRMNDSQAAVERNLILAQKCEELGRNNAENINKLEEAVEFGEKAIRARDQLAQRLREQAAEMAELREQEAKTYNDLTEKSKRDIQQIKQSSEDIVSQLKEDVRQLESKVMDKDIEVNRGLREIKALQQHVNRMENDVLTANRQTTTPEELYRRLHLVEQERDRLALLVESIQTSLKQKIEEMNQREIKFEKSMKDQNDRLKQTVERCEALNNERVQMAEEIHRLEMELGVKDKSLQVMNREIQSEVFTLREKTKLAEAERIAREIAMEESQKQSLLDMQQVNKLLRQQVAHWQAEFNNLQNINELRVRDLKEKLQQSKQRQETLESEVRRHGLLNTEMLVRMEEVKNAMMSMNTGE
ncbi:paramyosin-like [Paramacrobiotus metropolitanus]|uniref:paramyosin-like n=1 Tax=Paramacrobiotus metropolitanus TaxID=2943436 RepID=UPI0024464334|nr:paramyosin-like [Paramacrobiotus metropolitanus]